MEFRRIHDLPPYVFATVDQLKRELRRDGRDVIDLGFGNPDIPSPQVAVDKLCEAAAKPTNHRYSSSRGLPNLREAVCERYEKVFGVQLDPDLHVVSTIGAKEGLVAPDVGAGRAGRQRRRAEPRLPDPSRRAAPRRRHGPARADRERRRARRASRRRSRPPSRSRAS